MKTAKAMAALAASLILSHAACRAAGPIALDTLPPLDKAVMICKKFETLHHGQGKYIGYGHCILPGEPYAESQELTPEHAELLLRRDLARLHRMFSRYGDAAWLLSALAYNVGAYALLGHGDVPKSDLLKALERGERDIGPLYVKYCRYKGKEHAMLKKRRLIELKLLYKP